MHRHSHGVEHTHEQEHDHDHGEATASPELDLRIPATDTSRSSTRPTRRRRPESGSAHERRNSGRLFRFGGSSLLHGRMPVARLLEVSAVDEVRLVGSPGPVDGDTVVDTHDFVRPTMHDGVVRLVLRPAVDEMLVPFEQPNPTPCCADH